MTFDSPQQADSSVEVRSDVASHLASRTSSSSSEIRLDRSALLYQDFLLGAKLFWTKRAYQSLHNHFCKKVAESGGTEPTSFECAEKLVGSSPLYQFYGWMEHHLQRLKYAGSYGIVPEVEKQKAKLLRTLEKVTENAEPYLKLNPALELPRYFTSVEFHQQPGGVAANDLSGFVYEYGRKTTTPAHLHEDDLHHRMAAVCPTGNFKRILDFGCGVGKSTYPFKDRYPNAEVHGIDLSAPCLKVAHLRAIESGRQIFYSQQNIEQTEFPDEYFDLVHSTFIQHELPLSALRNSVAEAYRILKPGGYFVNLDFHDPPGGMFGKLVYYGHAHRNNEVFMRSFDETDYLSLLREAGFGYQEMLPFDDGTGLFSDPAVAPPQWRFPWQLFVSRKS